MSHHGVALVRLPTDLPIVGEDHPAATAHRGEPGLIRGVIREVVGVALDGEPGNPQNGREFLAEISVGEKDELRPRARRPPLGGLPPR